MRACAMHLFKPDAAIKSGAYWPQERPCSWKTICYEI